MSLEELKKQLLAEIVHDTNYYMDKAYNMGIVAGRKEITDTLTLRDTKGMNNPEDPYENVQENDLFEVYK